MMSDQNIRADTLDPVQQQVADLIGQDNFQRLMEVYGGTYLYIPKVDKMERLGWNEQIRAEFDGYNFRFLAQKYGLTEVTIRRAAQPMDGQLSLL